MHSRILVLPCRAQISTCPLRIPADNLSSVKNFNSLRECYLHLYKPGRKPSNKPFAMTTMRKARVVILTNCSNGDCSMNSDRRHLLAQYKEVPLVRGQATAISYAWGQFDRPTHVAWPHEGRGKRDSETRPGVGHLPSCGHTCPGVRDTSPLDGPVVH